MTALGLAGWYTEMRYGESHPWNSFWPAVMLVQFLSRHKMDVERAQLVAGVELAVLRPVPFTNGAMRSINRFGLIGIILMLVVIELTVLQHYGRRCGGAGCGVACTGGVFLGLRPGEAVSI